MKPALKLTHCHCHFTYCQTRSPHECSNCVLWIMIIALVCHIVLFSLCVCTMKIVYAVCCVHIGHACDYWISTAELTILLGHWFLILYWRTFSSSKLNPYRNRHRQDIHFDGDRCEESLKNHLVLENISNAVESDSLHSSGFLRLYCSIQFECWLYSLYATQCTCQSGKSQNNACGWVWWIHRMRACDFVHYVLWRCEYLCKNNPEHWIITNNIQQNVWKDETLYCAQLIVLHFHHYIGAFFRSFNSIESHRSHFRSLLISMFAQVYYLCHANRIISRIVVGSIRFIQTLATKSLEISKAIKSRIIRSQKSFTVRTPCREKKKLADEYGSTAIICIRKEFCLISINFLLISYKMYLLMWCWWS